ncbi:MAG: glycosyltransferase family 9 protein [Candidatus Dormibacteria bacterium]
MRIAVVVSGGVTETVQATPLLRTLRAASPEAQITLIYPRAAASVADGVGGVEELVGLRSLDGHRRLRPLAPVWLALRRRRLEAVLICGRRPCLRAAAYLAGVPERIGPGGGTTSLLLTARPHAAPGENDAPTWLRMAAVLGHAVQIHNASLEPGPEARRDAERLLEETGLVDGRLLIALAPGEGAAEPKRDGRAQTAWDPQRWALLANGLARRQGAGIVLLGNADDRAVIDQMMLDLGVSVADLSGEHDLRVVAGILARCDLFVGADGPLLHLAGAVGTPAVGLFGPTDGRARGPYGAGHRIIQAQTPATNGDGPAGSHMDQIRVEDVLAGIEAGL